MQPFLLVTDQNADDGVSRLVLIAAQHIVEVRPLGNPISDGALVTMSNGRQLSTADPFDKLVQKLHA